MRKYSLGLGSISVTPAQTATPAGTTPHHEIEPLTTLSLDGRVSGNPDNTGAQYVIRIPNGANQIVIPHWHPEELVRLQRWFRGQPVPVVLLQAKYLQARTSEFENIQQSAEQARSADHMGEKPLIVLTASRVIDAGLKAALKQEDQMAYEQTWINDLQLRLTRLSRHGRRMVVLNSGHDMPFDRHDAIVSAVRELCDVQNIP